MNTPRSSLFLFTFPPTEGGACDNAAEVLMTDFATRVRNLATRLRYDIKHGVGCYLSGEGSLCDLWDFVRGYEV